MKRVLGLVCAIVLVFGVAGNEVAQALYLSDLLEPGASITADDKLFSDWWIDFDRDAYDPEDLGYIEVSPINDPTNPGLHFVAGEILYVAYPLDDGWFYYGFTVTSLDPSTAIVDNTLTITEPYFGGEEGAVYGYEFMFESGTTSDPIAEKQVYADNSSNVFYPSDTAEFAPHGSLDVRMTWYLYTHYEEGVATGLREWEQRFSQASAPVPEPATVLLLGTGLVGLVGFRKKFKK